MSRRPLALALLAATALPATAKAQSAGLVDVCSGLAVDIPVLQPVAGVASGLLAGLLDPVLNGIVGNVNVNLRDALSGRNIGLTVRDLNGNLVTLPGNCKLRADGLTVEAPGGIAVGGGEVTGLGGTANAKASAADANAIALGNGAATSGTATGAVAIGLRGAVTGADGVAIGRDGTVSAAGGVALGAGSLARRAGLSGAAEAFSGTAVASTQGALSIGSAGNERQITDVAGGTRDTDAVNLRQLRSVANSTASALGGGAGFDANGRFTGPNYALRSGSYTDVGAALTALDQQNGVVAGNNTSGHALASAAGDDALAAGYGARSDGVRATALGTQAQAGGNGSVAVGHGSAASAAGGVALGAGSLARRAGLSGAAEAFSGTAVASTQGALSIGSAGNERQITDVAGATQDTDAVNLRQLRSVASSTASALGGGAGFDADGRFTGPAYALRGSVYADVGSALTALDQQNGVIAGNNTSGHALASAAGGDALAAGYGARSDGVRATALGTQARAGGDGSVAVGHGSAASAAGGVALGAGSLARRAGLSGAAEAFSGTAVASTQGAVSIGSAGGERQITDVAGGTQDTDAVNLRQLRSVATSTASALGGGAGFDGDGRFTGPAYALRGSVYADVGAALTALDQQNGAVAGNNTSGHALASAGGDDALAAGYGARAEGARATAIGTQARASGHESVAIGAGAVASRPRQVAIGTAASTYTLPGLASAASRAAQSGPTQVVTTDASGNLAAIPVDLAALDQRVDGVAAYARDSRREARQGVAAAMAMTGAPLPSRPGKTSWAGNTATYKGEWAAGFAVAHRLDVAIRSRSTPGSAWPAAASAAPASA